MDINNLTNFIVDEKKFSTVAKKILKGENRKTETISLAFVGSEEIRKLNKEFRKIDKPTDVLSFSAQGGPASGGELAENFLGEVVICPNIVKEKKEDIMKVFIHGVLHLLGYDHEKSEKEAEIMEEKEKKYLSEISF